MKTKILSPPYTYHIKQLKQQGKNNIKINISSQQLNQQLIRKQQQYIKQLKNDNKILANNLKIKSSEFQTIIKQKNLLEQSIQKSQSHQQYLNLHNNNVDTLKSKDQVSIYAQMDNQLQKSSFMELKSEYQIKLQSLESQNLLLKQNLRTFKQEFKKSKNMATLNNHQNQQLKNNKHDKTSIYGTSFQTQQQQILCCQVAIQTDKNILPNNDLALTQKLATLQKKNQKLNKKIQKYKNKNMNNYGQDIELEQQIIELTEVQIQTEPFINEVQVKLNDLSKKVSQQNKKIKNERMRVEQFRELDMQVQNFQLCDVEIQTELNSGLDMTISKQLSLVNEKLMKQNNKLKQKNRKLKYKQKQIRNMNEIECQQEILELSEVQTQTEQLIDIISIQKSQNRKPSLQSSKIKQNQKEKKVGIKQFEEFEVEQQTIELVEVQQQTQISQSIGQTLKTKQEKSPKKVSFHEPNDQFQSIEKLKEQNKNLEAELQRIKKRYTTFNQSANNQIIETNQQLSHLTENQSNKQQISKDNNMLVQHSSLDPIRHIKFITQQKSQNQISFKQLELSKVNQLTQLIKKLESENQGLNKDVANLQDQLKTKINQINKFIHQPKNQELQSSVQVKTQNNFPDIQSSLGKDIQHEYDALHEDILESQQKIKDKKYSEEKRQQLNDQQLKVIIQKLYQIISINPPQIITINQIKYILATFYNELEALINQQSILSKKQKSEIQKQLNQSQLPLNAKNSEKISNVSSIKKCDFFDSDPLNLKTNKFNLPYMLIKSEGKQIDMNLLNKFEPIFIKKQEISIENQHKNKITQLVPIFQTNSKQQLILRPFFIQKEIYQNQPLPSYKNKLIAQQIAKIKPSASVKLLKENLNKINEYLQFFRKGEMLTEEKTSKFLEDIGNQRFIKHILNNENNTKIL